MARKAKEIEGFADVVVEESTSPKKYYAKFAKYGFDVPAVDEQGKIRIKMNNVGNPVYDTQGNVQPIHLHFEFDTWSDRAKAGYLSVFNYDPTNKDEFSKQRRLSDAQNKMLGDVLDKIAANTSIERVMSEDAYEKTTNSAMWIEKQKAKALAAELKAKDDILNSPEALQKRIDELMKG